MCGNTAWVNVRKIFNSSFYKQYASLMSLLSYQKGLSDEDRIVVVYYMLLQDRIEEALVMFKEVSRGNIPMKIQYDYCQSYLSFYTGNLGQANKHVAKYQNYPVARWRKLFAVMDEQLKEIQGQTAAVIDQTDRTEKQNAAC